ncbi:XrtN system VIT domain-containing protein [bacterium SCSIO 12741]|nr:XrtN system VIT domain-containing protein [bacterium SCSIO 12741]
MSTSKNTKEFTDNLVGWKRVGIGMILVSLALFLAGSGWIPIGDHKLKGDGLFVLNYAIAALYFVSTLGHTLFTGGLRSFRVDRQVFLIAVTLFCISAFSFNLTLRLFSDFTLWVRLYLLVMLFPLAMNILYRDLPIWARIPVAFTIGMGMVLSLSFATYLLPMAGIGLILFFILGLSLHLLAPAILFFSYISQAIKMKLDAAERWWLALGIALPVGYLIFFLIQWSVAKDTLITSGQKAHLRSADLPRWVVASQFLNNDGITEKMLAYDLQYDHRWLAWNDFNVAGTSYGENRQHDPLVWFAKSMVGTPHFTQNERIQMLSLLRNKRHLAHRKLWSGSNLKTQKMESHWDIYPEYRLAYIEKKLFIEHSGNGRDQEALYTFHVPEGAVVTSMSLVIEGREEMGRLTTRHKADTAYRSIVRPVNRRPRDPSLVHWQEGNRVTVTVYPCTPEEVRELKVGFTVPLKIGKEQLFIPDIWFEGPYADQAPEDCSLQVISDHPTEWIHFEPTRPKLEDGMYSWKSNYGKRKDFILKSVPLSSSTFSFQNRHYQLVDGADSLSTFIPERVYLDVNGQWTQEEWDYLLETYAEQDIYVHRNKMIQVTPENQHKLFSQLLQKRFSCFPFFEIECPETSLLVAKSSSTGPNLTDLRDSPFGKKLLASLEEEVPPIHLLEMGEYSPLYKTFLEFGLFNATQGTVYYAREMQDKHQFKAYLNSDRQIEIPGSRLLIQEVDSALPGNAPDHVMRLFAYNHVLHQSGRTYFVASREIPDPLIEEAAEAFVVTPISSLVALETENDYKRFGIDKNKQGLKNASKHQSGAVPEPHEWALILLAGVILFGFLIKRLT